MFGAKRVSAGKSRGVHVARSAPYFQEVPDGVRRDYQIWTVLPFFFGPGARGSGMRERPTSRVVAV